MENIKESLKILFLTKEHNNFVNKFAKDCYNERFKNMKLQYNSYLKYEGFDVISKNKIKIYYTYGGGEMNFNDSFEIEI
jgi:hypothetical protein